ncbi:hypothetical protein [Caloranaerobacter sp. DY30410]|uniref:hypothetical protein n=1 Tax=Caloranaerobacter sp. DY30410 TaxID=3238305 RepID=UPI003CFF54E1
MKIKFEIELRLKGDKMRQAIDSITDFIFMEDKLESADIILIPDSFSTFSKNYCISSDRWEGYS